MPEVQKPVLEHAPTEAQNPQVTDGKIAQNSDVVNLVTSVTEIRKMDKGQKYLSYEMNVWLDPETRTATLLSMTEPVEIIVG